MMCDSRIEVAIGDPSDPFIITSKCDIGVSWVELALPAWTLRNVYAPPSAWVPGNVMLSSVQDAGEVSMVVTVEEESAAALMATRSALRSALLTWPDGEVKVTLIEDSGSTVIAGPWQSFPTVPQWDDTDGLLHGAYYLGGRFSIPVNPAGAP